MKKKSVRSRYSGFSFASAASKIGKKYKDRDVDSIAKNSFLHEISSLIALQDVSRAKEVALDTIKDNRKPTNPSKYGWGTPPFGLDPNTMKSVFGYPTTKPGQFDNILNPDMSRNAFDPSQVPSGSIGSPSPTIASRSNTNIAKITGNFASNFKLPESPLAGVEADAGAGKGGGGNSFLKDNIYAPLAIGKGLEFLGKTAMTLSGASKVDPEYNPYESQIRTTMASRGFNNDAVRNAILSQQNAANSQISGIGNASVQAAMRQNMYSGGIQRLAESEMAMQSGRNNLKSEYAQTLNNLGQQQVQARNYAEQLNEQGQATQQMSLQNLLETVGGAGQRLTDYRAGIAQQSLLASALSTSDFQFGDISTLLKDAINMRRIDPNKAIEIIQNSKGKSKASVADEVEKAMNDFRNAYNS